MKRFMKFIILMVIVTVLTGTLTVTAGAVTKDTYNQKVNAFLSDGRWCNGAWYGSSQKPLLSPGTQAWGCCAYAVDYSMYVYGQHFSNIASTFKNPSEIRDGDILKVLNSQHWIVVVSRNGNSLRTAEGNWTNGRVSVSNGVYTISGNTLCRNGKAFRTFSVGYHLPISGTSTPAPAPAPAPAANSSVDRILFNADLYYSLYEDLRNAIGYNPDALYSHYVNYGRAEGRIASLIFDPHFYMAHNPDVANAYGATNWKAAYDHFAAFGLNEGRASSVFYNGSVYLSKYSDLKNVFQKPGAALAEHFTVYGYREWRTASTTFSVSAYRDRYSDLRAAFGTGDSMKYFVHYLQYGQNEHRSCT